MKFVRIVEIALVEGDPYHKFVVPEVRIEVMIERMRSIESSRLDADM